MLSITLCELVSVTTTIAFKDFSHLPSSGNMQEHPRIMSPGSVEVRLVLQRGPTLGLLAHLYLSLVQLAHLGLLLHLAPPKTRTLDLLL